MTSSEFVLKLRDLIKNLLGPETKGSKMIWAKMWNPSFSVVLDFVKNAAGVVKTKTRCRCGAPGGRL